MTVPVMDDLVLVDACYAAWLAGDLDFLIEKCAPGCVYQIHAPRDVLHHAGRHEPFRSSRRR